MNRAWGIRGAACLASLMLWSIAGAPATSQTVKVADIDDLFAAMERLQIGVPMNVAGRDPVRRHLAELNREPCDQRAVAIQSHYRYAGSQNFQPPDEMNLAVWAARLL
jgi:hypothetical protein